jgi:hypothetical protein
MLPFINYLSPKGSIMTTNTEDTIAVFTARSPDRIVAEGGSQAWVLNPARAKHCTWLVCTQNQHNPDHEFEDATEPHGEGFLVGRISSIRKTEEPQEDDKERYIIGISEFARIKLPNAWDGGRNPVRYTSLATMGIDVDTLTFEPIPEAAQPTPSRNQAAQFSATTAPLTIAEAKRQLATAFGVKVEAVEITIRG